MILGGGKGSNFNFVDFEKIFGQKWAPRIRNRAHISQNLSGQKIVQFSEMTPPLHGRSPKMQISHFSQPSCIHASATNTGSVLK